MGAVVAPIAAPVIAMRADGACRVTAAAIAMRADGARRVTAAARRSAMRRRVEGGDKRAAGWNKSSQVKSSQVKSSQIQNGGRQSASFGAHRCAIGRADLGATGTIG
jgi:hypothetical protein